MGVFAKLPDASYFLDFMNYFSKEKSHGIGPWSVDRVHGGMVHQSMRFIKRWPLVS
jgi:hypothetical protein